MENSEDLFELLFGFCHKFYIKEAYERGYITSREYEALKEDPWTNVEGRDVFIEDKNVIYVKDAFRLYWRDGDFVVKEEEYC